MNTFEVISAGRGQPELSVLMPVYQQERFVVEALASVLGQRDVVAEVIVSDDASTDATWGRVQHALETAAPHPHRLVVRRGRTRLRRDHTIVLAERAVADVVMVAHGDDVSEPGRARLVVDVLTKTRAVLTGSRCLTIDSAGRTTPTPPANDVDLAPRGIISPADTLSIDGEFVGAVLAWRKAPMAAFPRLDSAYLASGHDFLLPFRAALAGGATVIPEPLVRRRVHAGSWSNAIWDRRRQETIDFGRHLSLLGANRAMRSDLLWAHDLGLINVDEEKLLTSQLVELEQGRLREIMRVHDALIGDGLVPLWVSGQEANLAYRGSLGTVLARRARLWGPVELGLATARRVRDRRQSRR